MSYKGICVEEVIFKLKMTDQNRELKTLPIKKDGGT